MSRLNFTLEAEAPDSRARATTFHTLHGAVQTPIFMPVGTQATVKSQTVDSLKTTGSRVLLANTYHLLLRPGPEVFRKFGGIHRFMNWDGPVLTDSGGFQIFSLPKSREMKEEGARFQSYLDGSQVFLSPEKSIEMQRAIGSDIMMVLDQCIPSTAGREEAIAAMELTHRWAARSLAAREDSPQSMFGIVQGACFPDLRKQSADFLTQLPFDGFAIGGLAVGETKAQRDDFTELTAQFLPRNLPRYLMGVGTPSDLLEAVHRGVDMFDCILPSQLAKRGTAYTSLGRLQMRRTTYKLADETLDPDCPCVTCLHYSRAYLHHLCKADETVGWKLLTTHNLTFFHRLMRSMRENILAGSFAQFYRANREKLAQSDNTCPEGPQPARQRGLRKPSKATLGDYEVQSHEAGFHSIRQLSSGEVMHSVSDPTEEATRLYVVQPELAKRFSQPSVEPLIVWDVGLGGATNAMAAIACYEATQAARPFHLVSFERDLDPLRLVLSNRDKFPHARHPAAATLLKKGVWQSDDGRVKWELLAGDFLDLFASAPAPDLIFYDPFSFKTDGVLWTPEVFARLYRHCAGRAVELFTYSASTAVRASLLAAGFYVARGFSTGPKSDTTRAFAGFESGGILAGAPLLDDAWLGRWNRSHSKFPTSVPESEWGDFESKIRNHPQFSESRESNQGPT